MKNKKYIYLIVFLIISFILGIAIYKTTSNRNEKINISAEDEASKKRLQEEDLKTKEYLENNNTNQSEADFTLEKAIEICEEKYGTEEDIIYVGSDIIESYDDKLGYFIQVKSKELVQQQGNGVLFSVFVSENGDVVEIN